MSGEPSVEVATDLAAIEAAEREWWALWRRVPDATPFQSPAWLIPWWRAFYPGELHTILVHQRGELIGLAALYVEEGALGRRLLPLGISVSDYLDVLIDPALADAASRAIVTRLDAARQLWDGLDLEELPPSAAALKLPSPAGCEETVAQQSACPVLSLGAGVQEIAQIVPKTKARKLRMAQNRLARRAAAEVIRIEADQIDGFLDEMFRLHDARWQSRGEAGVLADPRVRRFHRQAIDGLFGAGLLRLSLLRAGDQVVGAYYGFNHGGRAYAYLGGFDPDFTFESPGTILIGDAVGEAIREGAREFHFLRGREPYKYEWGAQDRWNKRRSFRRRDAVLHHA